MSSTVLFRQLSLEVQPDLEKLLANGFEPVPIYGAQKKPLIREWQCPNGPVTLDRVIQQIKDHPDHTSMGLLTRNMAVVDIDLYDLDLIAGAKELVEHHLGYTPLQRFGSKGIMPCYRRIGEPFGKKTISRTKDGKTPDGMDERQGHALIELFGNGQVVVAGIHPNTQKPYRWLSSYDPNGNLVDGMNPLTVRLADLPPVTEAMMEALKRDLIELLSQVGYDIQSRKIRGTNGGSATSPNPPMPTGHVECAKDITKLFLDRIGNYIPRRSGWLDLHICPGCGHHDSKAGLRVLADGGFEFHCHHASCPYNSTTGWRPGSFVGRRVKELYEALGGDRKDFIHDPYERYLPDVIETIELLKQIRGGKTIVR